MPTYVANNVNVTGPIDAVDAFYVRCLRVIESNSDVLEFDFEAIVPSGTPEVSAEDEAMMHINRRILLWGTKWEALDTMILDRKPGYLEFEFMTASNWPQPIYRALGRAFPNLAIAIAALEPGTWWAVVGRIKGDLTEFDETVDPRSVYKRIYKQPFDEAD